ncbi:MAG: DMT family transporter [Lautropia sp.]
MILPSAPAPISVGVQAILWAMASGMLFSVLNALMRAMTLELPPLQVLNLRYTGGVVALMPLVLVVGWRRFRPVNVAGQFWRGAAHTGGLLLWFSALPLIPLADTTAIGFTSPLFLMLGATLFLKEPMVWQRWVAAVAGFTGVLVVVGPRLSDENWLPSLMMLASAVVFAASYLITKVLTRHDRPDVIVLWQSLSIAILTLPVSIVLWQPLEGHQWAIFLLGGAMGSAGHWCLTTALKLADVSVTQPIKFLELVWATLLGWFVFSDQPAATTLLGGGIIVASTLTIARWESRERRRQAAEARAARDRAGTGTPLRPPSD